MSEIGKRLIIMLGMHRSGTSTITRGLKVLGVELGNKLMPPVLGDNDKGYFEDIDLNALNVEMLDALGSDWHCLSPIDQSDVDSLRKKGYFVRAVNLLRQKTECVSIFGFKDPRVSKLLPFWQLVFLHCGYDVGYVLAIRNPLSVAQSLKKRVEFKYEKSYLLWLGHVLVSLSQTQDKSRVIVDYDQFIHFPKNNLKLIAKQLNLSLNSKSLQEYQTEFLDVSLRHSFYAASDLLEDATCPPLVSEIYQYLLDLASKNMQEKAVQAVQAALNSKILLWMNEFNRLKTSLRMVDSLYEEIANYQQAVNSCETKIVSLNESVIENQQKSLEQVTQARQQREDLLQTMAEREKIFSQQILELQKIHEQQKGVQTQQYMEREQAYILDYTQARQQREDLLLTMAEREKVFSQQLLEMQQMHEQQNGVQTQQYMEREQAYILDYMQARQQREDLLLTMAEREKVFSRQLQEVQTGYEQQKFEQNRKYTAREQTYLGQLARARQQIESRLQQQAEREIEFSRQLQVAQQLHEQKMENQSREHMEYVRRINAELVEKHAELICQIANSTETEKMLANRLSDLHREIDFMRSTYSWRWSAPFRSLFRILDKKTFDNFKVAPTLLANSPEDNQAIDKATQSSETLLPTSSSPSMASNRIADMSLNEPITTVMSLDELLSYHDQRFIYFAYVAILGREPDSTGMLYYLKRVRAGVSKIEILSQLRLSKEGKFRRVTMAGLDNKIKRYYWLKIPILGSLLGLVDFKRRRKALKVSNIIKNKTYAHSEVVYPEFVKGIGQIPFNLQPQSQLEKSAYEESCWESLGQDPNFKFVFNSADDIPLGWYCIELCITTECKKSIAKIYLDTGHGFNETETVLLPYISGEVTSRIFLIEKTILAIRFDPLEEQGRFQLDTLLLTSISESLACSGMVQQLALKQPTYKNMSPESVALMIQAAAKVENKPFIKYLASRYYSTYKSQQFSVDYKTWIDNVEQLDQPTHETALATIAKMTSRPLISIIMPVYNTPEVYLRACIDSVRAQSYFNWELCIADDNSPNEEVCRILKEYQSADSRIRVVYRKENGHISKSSNSALEIAAGDFVALLDHDDALPEHALFFMVDAINKHPAVQVLYSDEDKIDSYGARFEPHFKGDWNPDLFFSQNYVSHLCVYRRELLMRIGGFRTGVEGSQDQDLLLRCLPHIEAKQIIHIPRVLYHWRAIEGSTAMVSDAKDYTTKAGIKALNDYFKEQGPNGVQVEKGFVPNTYRVSYPIPTPAPLVSLLIPTRDRCNLVEACVRSILSKSTYNQFEILILDNGSREPETLRFFKVIQAEDERVRVLKYDHPFNYSAINNFGVLHAKGMLIGLINNDIEVISPGWLTEMVAHCCRPEIGCVGAKLYFENDTIQHAGVICGLGGVAGHGHGGFSRDHPGYFSRLVSTQTVSAVTAACLLVRREVFEQVDGLDEVNLKVAFNDVDFCLKVREAGYRNLWTPYAELYHYESISRGADDTPEKQARFISEVEFMQKKWGSALEVDPFYSPNLARDLSDFSIKRPL